MIEIDTLVVGAGPQALTVVARWVCDRPSAVEQFIAVDPAGTWLRAWDRQLERQRVDVLRSPGVHQPDPDEMALLRAHRYIQRRRCRSGRPEPETLNGPIRRPTTVAFSGFCRELIERTGLAQRVLPATVSGLRQTGNQRAPRRWEADLSDGTMVRTSRVLWAGNPHEPNVPPGVRLCEAVVHSTDVDVAAVAPGQRIIVIGGGQTAGQLALVAAGSGAEVLLVYRGAQRVVDLDVDAGWLMDNHLTPFRSIDDPAERRRVVERARRGSMNAELADALHRSSVRWLTDAGELTARPDGDGVVVGFAGAEVPADLVWLATGSRPDLRADPVLAERAAAGAPHVDGWPILDDRLQWEDGLVIVGALAALTLGPAAGNLGGARAAAELLAADLPPVSAPRPRPSSCHTGRRALRSVGGPNHRDPRIPG
ncbi:MAG: hypothetical protein AAF547_04105 [Actinomycetota bacterium]